MNRCFALVLTLALILALLTSCELLAPGPTERPPIGRPGESIEPTPTETTDPTVDGYGFTIFPEGNYLADKKFDTDEFLPDYDADPSFIQFLTTGHNKALCQTNDTVYACIGGLANGGLIMYMDKATGISAPLCGKPECLHSNSSCNAYVSWSAHGLRVYAGKLYWIDNRSSIMRMNLDGTDRETVVSTAGVYDHISNDPTVVIHRGYVYAAGSQHAVVVDGKRMGSVTINAHPLNSGEGFTILDKLVEGYGAECLIKPVGNDLYIMLYTFDYENGENLEEKFETVEFYRWDSRTRQVEFISSLQTSSDGLHLEKWSFHPVPGDGIYLEGYYLVETEDGSYQKDCVCKYSFETGILEEIMCLDDDGDQWFFWPVYTKDYIFADSNFAKSNSDFELMIYVYDYNYELVYRIGPFEDHDGNDFMGADDAFVYYLCWTGGSDDAEHGRHFIAVPFDGGDVIVIG